MRNLFFAFALLLGPLAAQSQYMTLGPTLGVNIASISDQGNSKACVRPNFGINFVYSVTEHFGLGVAALYSMEGSQFDDEDFEGYTHLDYLRIPVRASWFFGELGQQVRPKIFAGLSPAFMVGGKTRVELPDPFPAVETDSKDDFTGFDLGVLVGAGLNYRIGDAIWLQFDVHYTHGLINISEIEGPDYKNRNLGVNLGVGFPIGAQ